MSNPDTHEAPSWAHRVLCGTALLLAVAHLYIFDRQQPETVVSSADSPPVSQIKPGTSLEDTTLTAAAAPTVPFEWAPVESSDYKEYIQNLRQLSFPEDLIREIIVADVNRLYASREEPLKIRQVPHDAPFSERRRPPTTEDVQHQTQLLAISIEKQDLLQELLGVRVPRELLRTPNSRAYEAYEYALTQLPPEKQEAVQRIQEQVFLEDDMAQVQHEGRNVPAFKAINEKRDEALHQLLTPDEFDRYMMNTMPAGTEMARRIIGMDATDEELVKIWHLTDQQWKEQGGVYDWWRAERPGPDVIKRADEKLAAGLREALGEERYIDYQMAVSETGQQLRNFASRYDLPRETLTSAFAVQTELDSLSKAPLSQPTRTDELQQQLGQILGPDLLQTWNEGRRLQYDLQP